MTGRLVTDPNACASSEYLKEFTCELRQPAWLSDVGLPLVATLAGLVIAFLLLRRQIGHDVELRRADRRAAVVNQFGVEAVDVIRSLWDHDGSDAFWRAPKWPEWATLYDSQRRARAALGETEPFPEFMMGYRDLNYAWQACAARRLQLEAKGKRFSDVSNFLAMDSTLHHLTNDLHEAAERFVSWDGRGDVPEATPWPSPHIPLPSHKHRDRYSRWMEYYATYYEREVERIQRREDERAAKRRQG